MYQSFFCFFVLDLIYVYWLLYYPLDDLLNYHFHWLLNNYLYWLIHILHNLYYLLHYGGDHYLSHSLYTRLLNDLLYYYLNHPLRAWHLLVNNHLFLNDNWNLHILNGLFGWVSDIGDYQGDRARLGDLGVKKSEKVPVLWSQRGNLGLNLHIILHQVLHHNLFLITNPGP